MRLLLILALCAAPQLVDAQERVVLRARPVSRVISEAASAKRSELPVAERDQNQLLTVERDGRYFWASREDRELQHVFSGIYHLYIDPRGGGYVKILDQRHLTPGFKVVGPDIQYLEHVALGLTTLTYWGSSTYFDP
jgi:hypothetical protein